MSELSEYSGAVGDVGFAAAVTSNSSLANFYSTTGGSYQTSGCAQWAPSYSWYCSHPHDSAERAYRVVRALMKAKVLRVTTIAKFFDAVDEVLKVL